MEMTGGHPWTGVSVEELQVRWRVLVFVEGDSIRFTDAIIDSEPMESIPVVEMLMTRWPGSNQEVCNLSSELFVPQKWLLFVLKWNGKNWRFQFGIRAPSADKSDISEIPSTICLQGLNLSSILWKRSRVPFQPLLPAIGHGVGQHNLQDAGPFPVATPPFR